MIIEEPNFLKYLFFLQKPISELNLLAFSHPDLHSNNMLQLSCDRHDLYTKLKFYHSKSRNIILLLEEIMCLVTMLYGPKCANNLS